MIYNVYCIDDLKSVYMAPFIAASDGVAVRDFKLLLSRSDTPMHAYPSDFRLMHIGTYDDKTGALDSHVPEVVIDGKDCID